MKNDIFRSAPNCCSSYLQRSSEQLEIFGLSSAKSGRMCHSSFGKLYSRYSLCFLFNSNYSVRRESGALPPGMINVSSSRNVQIFLEYLTPLWCYNSSWQKCLSNNLVSITSIKEMPSRFIRVCSRDKELVNLENMSTGMFVQVCTFNPLLLFCLEDYFTY